ncbi:MAG: hypothetical protein KJ072_23870, partial [Verrucomicrobia bacterium]|nr:hypothetical protein [Verrucomicrobiota bacterium]
EADLSGGTLRFTQPLENTGTIQVLPGAALWAGRDLWNDGLIRIDRGTLEIEGSLRLGANGRIETVEPGSLRLARHWLGASANQDAATGSLRLVLDGGGQPAPDLGANAFYVEAEDFNFDRGQHEAVANAMPYLGGAYDGHAGRDRIDYSQTSNQTVSDVYRVKEGPDVNVNIYAMTDLDRGAYRMNVNYKIGYNDATEWYNYTRVYPAFAEPTCFFARLSSGGQANAVQIDEVTGSANTTSQTLAKLGEVRGPASGDWNRFVYVPLRNDAGELLLLNWSGQKTFRITILPGSNEDLDCFVLAPASSSGPTQLFEVMGRNLGSDVAGFNADTAIDSITLAANSQVQLVDRVDNSPGAGAEALYVRSLVVPAGTTLDLNGFALYAQEVQIHGEVINGTVLQVLPEAPELAIRLLGTGIELSWPATAGGYYLEHTEQLPPAADWQTVSTPPVPAGDRQTVIQSPSAATRFYRLRHD